jgi:hypothetical protein
MTSDEARLRGALHELVAAQPFEPDVAAIERRGHRARRRALAGRGVAGLAAAGAAIVVLLATGTILGPAGRTAPGLTIRSASAHGGALIRLAASIEAHPQRAVGDATLVLTEETIRTGPGGRHLQRTAGAELFTDAGPYYTASLDPIADRSYPHDSAFYAAHPVKLLAAEIAAHHTTESAPFAREEAAAIRAAHGHIEAARRQMAEALGIVGRAALSTTPGSRADGRLVPIDAWIWDNSEQALEKGAGNPEVRAGVLRLVATLPGVTVTHTTTDRRPTLTLRAGRAEAGVTGYQLLVIDAHSGIPVRRAFGPGARPQDVTTFTVRRVTVASIARGG